MSNETMNQAYAGGRNTDRHDRRESSVSQDASVQGLAAEKLSRTAQGDALVQQLAERSPGAISRIQQAAAHGISGSAGTLPHHDAIQRSFGRHDVSGIQAHTDSAAQQATQMMGARAYATGDHVVLGGASDLHTAAHEAAHVVQQRGGVQLAGGVGQVGDRYEQHADAVADAVVQGKSAESLLDVYAGTTSTAGEATQQKADARSVQLDDGGGSAAGQQAGANAGSSGDDSAGQEAEDPDKQIKSIVIEEIGSVSAVEAPGGARAGGKARGVAGDVQGADMDVQFGGGADVAGVIINGAQTAWDIVKDNRPQATAQTKFCQAVPDNIPWNQLHGWRTNSKSFRMRAENLLGIEVVNCAFTVTYQYDGRSSRAAGRFLNNYSIYCTSADVSWGFSVDANASVQGNAFNSGTEANPVGAVPLHFSFSIGAVFQNRTRGALLTAHGDRKLEVA